MSVINPKEFLSTFVKLPQHSQQPSCCCVKTCVNLPNTAFNSTLKVQTKDKLLQMISSLQKEYNQQLQSKQQFYEEKIRELESTIGTMKLQSFQLQRSPQKTMIQVDQRREKELLDRIQQLQKQKSNVVSNKVSYIQTTLTNKIHSLQHQLQNCKLFHQQQTDKLKQQLNIKQQKNRNLIQQHKLQKQKLKQSYSLLQIKIKDKQINHNNQLKQKQDKKVSLQKQILTFTIQKRYSDEQVTRLKQRILNLQNIIDKKQEEFKQKEQLNKKSTYDIQNLLQAQIERSHQLLRQMQKQNQQLKESLRTRSIQLDDIKRQIKGIQQQFQQRNRQQIQLSQTRQNLQRQILMKQKYIQTIKNQNQQFKIDLYKVKLQNKDLLSQVEKLKIQIETTQSNSKILLQQSQAKTKKDWTDIYIKYQQQQKQQISKYKQQIEELNKDLQAQKQYNKQIIQINQKNIKQLEYRLKQRQRQSQQPKQKEYVLFKNYSNVQEGKVAMEKYLNISKDYVSLQASFKEMQFQNKTLNQNLKHFKSLQQLFNKQRQSWKLQKQQIIRRYQSKEKDGCIRALERIIQIQNNNESVKLQKNGTIVINQNIPQMSYLIVENEDEYKQHLKKESIIRLSRIKDKSKD